MWGGAVSPTCHCCALLAHVSSGVRKLPAIPGLRGLIWGRDLWREAPGADTGCAEKPASCSGVRQGPHCSHSRSPGSLPLLPQHPRFPTDVSPALPFQNNVQLGEEGSHIALSFGREKTDSFYPRRKGSAELPSVEEKWERV